MSKPFTTYDEQIEILEGKGLLIPNKEEAVHLLKKYSYFGLISGYKHPFKNRDKKYKLRTTINDIYALYKFDMELRELYLRYILLIENNVKSLISYYFCAEYGESENAYLNANNYNYTLNNQDQINTLISKLKDAKMDCQNHPYIKHQQECYANVPLWALIKTITLGTVSKLYSYLKSHAQTQISKEYTDVNEIELARMLDLLSRYRNVCAHNERLFDYKSGKRGIRDTKIHAELNLKRKNGRYIQGKQDLFAIVIVFKLLLDKADFDEFYQKMDILIKNLLNNTRIIEKTQILKLMGFPNNWEQIKGM